MRNGTEIRIVDMTKDHLRNTIKMLERSANSFHDEEMADAWSFVSYCRGDMASYYAEGDAERVSNKSYKDYLPDIYNDLVKEYNMRV